MKGNSSGWEPRDACRQDLISTGAGSCLQRRSAPKKRSYMISLLLQWWLLPTEGAQAPACSLFHLRRLIPLMQAYSTYAGLFHICKLVPLMQPSSTYAGLFHLCKLAMEQMINAIAHIGSYAHFILRSYLGWVFGQPNGQNKGRVDPGQERQCNGIRR
eukprot:1161571-Pelagomonas_calceolata.AAC.7